MKKKSFLAVLFLIFTACSHQSCKIEDRTDTRMTGNEKTSSQSKDLTQRVFVYKADGTLQCGQGQKIALDAMKKELAGIEVYSSETKNDGMMRIQVCGAPTGMCNVFEINQSDLEKAQALGFKKWMN